MKKDRIKYFIQVRLQLKDGESDIMLLEKEGYLIRIEAIEPGEYLYFVAAHDINKAGNQLLTWGIDEYYTGLKVIGGYPTRNVAIQQLMQYWRQRKHDQLISSINRAINIMKSKSTLANVNPENYNHSINDLSYMAYGRRVNKHE